MNDFRANNEQRELLSTELESREVTGLTGPDSNNNEATAYYEKKQLLLDEIEKLNVRRDKLLGEAEQLSAEIAPLEALLEGDEVMDADQAYEIRKQYNELKIPYDSLNLQASIITNQITRRESLANYKTLMASYTESMSNWKADEQELKEKRNSLSTRLEQVQQQATEDMAKARQAETDAATAYAQAVAWGDTEGEKNANADAQKAAKNLTTTTEQNRRQHLIISALEQELIIIDQHIAEAQREHKSIEKEALYLARIVLEEQWNEKAQELLDMGGKLWLAIDLVDGDQTSLRKLVLPEEGEKLRDWTGSDLCELSRKYTRQDVLSL
ncbi:chromosome segregation protein SMC [Pseudomonas idahonensis]|uniref:chromosome segregation protein SMC n=1 Tax=Pseudomonas idahonensis TaxID=2942628 RepID=UPI0030CAE87B